MKVINLVNPVNPVIKSRRGGFTIVELLVAMTLLVILLALSGVVFNTTVEAHRTAGATIDITRNLRAITDQLNADFRGLRKDAPVFIAFNALDTDGDGVLEHFDTIHFLADGDFQTMRQYNVRYDDDGDGVLDVGDPTRMETIYGNVARIYYGNSNTPVAVDYAASGLLARKSHILTSYGGVLFEYGQIPLVSDWPAVPLTYDYDLFDTSFGSFPVENTLEFNTITLTDWMNALNYLNPGPDGIFGTIDDVPANANAFITNCMTDISRPVIDIEDTDTLHLLLSQGVLQMQIQWPYTVNDLSRTIGAVTVIGPADVDYFRGQRWWPSVDPAGDATVDSDFNTMAYQFGVSFILPGGSSFVTWADVISANILKRCKTKNVPGVDLYFRDGFYPRALRFTFVLRDSNGLFADGRTFTHIVYLDN